MYRFIAVSLPLKMSIYSDEKHLKDGTAHGAQMNFSHSAVEM